MASVTLQRDERIGLGIAVVLHGALIAVMLVQPAKRDAAEVPERMTVSLATEVGLEATAPVPVAQSRAAVAPVLADDPAPVTEPEPQQAPAPKQVTPPKQVAPPKQVTAPPQRSVAVDRPVPRPAPRQTAAPRREAAAPRRTTAPSPRQAAAPKQAGGSRIGADFLPGAGSSSTSTETRAPAAKFGVTEQAALRQALARQLRPHWRSPQGVDVDQLVTLLSWDLNPDGSLNGRPRVASQSGINASNKAQAAVHAENAIKAVQLAAPFNLPDQYYDEWKRIRNWRFDRRS
ncbi:energy transducer TonB [Altererythrobacter aquiaggeris]|uniref:energy transducer TonB n=1 Tax=Aestuarierythrobacter aquiaggeris TaxID=1898396 RepID=UPI00301688D4